MSTHSRARSTTVRSKFGLTLLALALVAMIGLMLVFLVAGTARPRVHGTIRTAGLQDEVEIARDSLGVPHIRAGSENDLLFAQGWVHAQDRLWQMELFRRVAEGRLAEVMGED